VLGGKRLNGLRKVSCNGSSKQFLVKDSFCERRLFCFLIEIEKII